MLGAGNGSVAVPALIPFEKVAGKTRVMEDHVINAAGNDVIEVARRGAAKVEKAGVLSGDST